MIEPGRGGFSMMGKDRLLRRAKSEGHLQEETGILDEVECRVQPLRITLYEPAGRGGICHYTWELAEHLAQAGNDVLLLTTEDYELGNLQRHFGVRYLFTRSWVRRVVQHFARRSGGDTGSAPPSVLTTAAAGIFQHRLRQLRIRLLHLKAIAGFVHRWPDVVHFQWLAGRDGELSLMRTLRRMRILVIFTAHDALPLEHDCADERDFRERLYHAADGIIVHTEVDRRRLAQNFNLPPEDLAIVPHGAYDFRFGGKRSIEKEEARRRLDIPLLANVILFFGLIKRYKGLEYLVAAFELVEKQRDDAILLVVGDVYRGDLEGHGYYTNLLADLRTRRNVRTVTTYVPVDDIPIYFAAADVVVLPYTQTSQSGVLLTAYGFGRPVVVTDTGSLPEIVERGMTGFVVPPRDPEAIAGAVLTILADPARAREMGERALVLSTTVYSWSRIARQTMEAYILAANRRDRVRADARERFPAEEPSADRERS